MSSFSKINFGTDGGNRTHMVSRTILSRMRLPVPPHRHIKLLYNNFLRFAIHIYDFL